ncbi:flagellar basal-body MS-ring/collar protein FliF [Metabacillus iocasae]|uniref:Flagellar M-ring protein n=1 Tax=Priestia iocasae TaxID=2291674 RepID=A0ABS2QQY1_9BACI|nr:flagellar basal-body MS-ring/collar protein FliF [Metabacillus iocasae]MBM7701863.1 flagellar M-ring protein FliF [Metabacillus iocasae]
MNERLAIFKEKTKAFWTERSKFQKFSMVGGILAVFLIIGLVSFFASTEKLVPLYSNLSPQETGQIKAELDVRGIKSEISQSGTTISVPEQSVDSLKVDLAAQGIPNSGSIDYSFFSNNAGFGMTDNEFNVLKLDAMQTELANLIKNIEGVNDANVMITLPQESVWVKDQAEQASASIVLNTKPGYQFDQSQIKSLYHLASKSVPNLPTENIVIMNQNFEYFDLNNNEIINDSGSFVMQHGMKKEIERDIQRQVQKMLGTMMGHDKVVVSVTADVDFTKENREENLVVPVDEENMEGIAVSVERITETFSGNGSQVGGSVGTGEEDTPNYAEAGVGENGDYEKVEERINNDVNRIRKEIVESPYKVRDLGIQVMVEPPTPDNPNTLPEERVEDIQQLLGTIVRTTIQQDGTEPELTEQEIEDKVMVSVQPFYGKTVIPQSEQAGIPLWAYIAAGALLLVIVILIILLVRKSRNQSDGIDEEFDEYVEELEINKLETKKPLTDEQKRRQRLELMAKEQPEEFAKLMRTWISED